MKIQLLANGSRPWQKWVKYWGLSILIDETVLFDTFSSYDVLAKRLRRARVDLSKIQTVVISHDHWDHIGGLWKFLKEKSGINVYVPVHASEESKSRIWASGCHVVDAAGFKEIKPGIFLTDEIMGAFKGKIIPEHSIVLKTDRGLVLIVGCSHPGIGKIVQIAKQMFAMPVYGVIGGLHLLQSSTEEIYACADALQREGVSLIMPTHCTGMKAERVFKKVFQKGYTQIKEGEFLDL